MLLFQLTNAQNVTGGEQIHLRDGSRDKVNLTETVKSKDLLMNAAHITKQRHIHKSDRFIRSHVALTMNGMSQKLWSMGSLLLVIIALHCL